MHRSITFWLGIPFAVFVSWLWIDTHARWTTLAFDYSGGTYYLASWHGELWLQHYQFKEGSTNPEPTGVIFDQIPDDRGDGDAPTWIPAAPFRYEVEEEGTTTARGLAFAHWLVLIMYLAVWLGLLAWRRKLGSRPETAD